MSFGICKICNNFGTVNFTSELCPECEYEYEQMMADEELMDNNYEESDCYSDWRD